jgi:hypothetical protein
MPIVINGTTGVSGVDGSAGTPALQGGDTNTGIVFGTDTVGVSTGGVQRTTVDSSGRLLVGVGSANANGGILQLTSGITFPATAVAASDANTLDDYEEGTWTPSVGGTATYTVQTGTYTKVGRLVHVSVMLTINTIGTGSANSINSLPFAISVTNNDIGAFPGYVLNAANSYVSLGFDCFTNSINIYARTAASTSSGSTGFFGSGTALRMQMVYHTN